VEGGPSFEMSGVHGGDHYSVGGMFGSPFDHGVTVADILEMQDKWAIFTLFPPIPSSICTLPTSTACGGRGNKGPHKRLKDISGPINIMDYENKLGGNVTLAFPLSMGVSAVDVIMGNIVDVKACGKFGGVLCYDYDKLY